MPVIVSRSLAKVASVVVFMFFVPIFTIIAFDDFQSDEIHNNAQIYYEQSFGEVHDVSKITPADITSEDKEEIIEPQIDESERPSEENIQKFYDDEYSDYLKNITKINSELESKDETEKVVFPRVESDFEGAHDVDGTRQDYKFKFAHITGDTAEWYKQLYKKYFEKFGPAPEPYDSVDVRSELYGYCMGRWLEEICKVAWVAIENQNLDPIAPHPDQKQFCNTEKGCLSNIASVMKLLWCESRYTPNAYAEGYVQGTWNEARGIAQIGNGWVHIATDEQAYDWVWSVTWVASDYTRSSKRWYPECGVDYKK